MKVPAPFTLEGEHIGIQLPGARALFTTRRGGVSQGPFASLNLGLGTDDDPEHVHVNRERVAAMAGAPLAQGYQVHGTVVHRVDGAPAPGAARAQADGQATAQRGVAPVVLTADCLPVALASPGAVAMVHAGWRGLAAGILAQGVAALRDLGARGAVTAAIGPGAGPCCYEVDDEVHAAFARHGDAVRRGANLDLKRAARLELQGAGVVDVHDVGICTICSDPDLFFSHRRDRGVTGRQGGVAWIDGSSPT